MAVESISIMNGAILKFSIDFTVPKNAIFDKIEISDTLIEGLDFDSLKVLVNGTEKKPDTDAGYTLASVNYDPKTTPVTPSSFTLTISDPAVVNAPAVDTNINVILSAVIDDIKAMESNSDLNDGLYEFINEAIITPYIDGLPKASLNGTENVSFNEYKLYGFGGSDTIPRAADQNLIFPIHIPTFDAYSSYSNGVDPDLSYVIVFTPNTELDVTVDTDNLPVSVYSVATTGSVTKVDEADYKVDYTNPGKVKISIPHKDNLRNTTLYVVPQGTTGAGILDYTDAKVYSNVTLALNNGTSNIMVAAPFDVTTNIEESLLTLVKKTLV